MKLTYFLWGYPYDEAIIRAFQSQGFVVETVELSSEFTECACLGDIFFSVNFHSVISDFCQKKGIPYCSWVLQLPNYDLYTQAVFHECNYIGICDSYLVEKMWNLGVKKAFFLPDAVELEKRIEGEYVEREFCFIAKQPEVVLQKQGMSLYGQGYLDSFLQAQRVMYGNNFLETGLPKRVYQEVLNYNPIPDTILPQFQKLYVADYYLSPACTVLQQNIFIKNNEKIMTIYSDNDFDMCKSKKYPYVSNEKERWKIYQKKEFSLILVPHVFHNAIPREMLEVIAAGGFPICSYQKDYSYFFEQDENLAFFTNTTEFQQAVVRYGNHPEERIRVKENAYRIVSEGHTYYHRIIHMLEMWDRL